MTNKEKKVQMLAGIERRISALSGEKPLPYKLHHGHWLRDLVTMRAFLTNHPDLKAMLENMPK